MVKIKGLSKDYIDQILKLESHSAPKLPVYYPFDRETLEKLFIKNNDSKVYGAFDGNKLIGWAAYNCDEKENNKVYQICSLVVDKKYRRQGIGLKLFSIILEELLKKSPIKIYLTCYPKNIPSILLYLKNGFVIYDYKKDLYGKGGDRIYLKYENISSQRSN